MSVLVKMKSAGSDWHSRSQKLFCADTPVLPKQHCQHTLSAHMNCICIRSTLVLHSKMLAIWQKVLWDNSVVSDHSLSTPCWYVGLLCIYFFFCAVEAHSSHCSHLKHDDRLLQHPVIVEPLKIWAKLCRTPSVICFTKTNNIFQNFLPSILAYLTNITKMCFTKCFCYDHSYFTEGNIKPYSSFTGAH